MSIQEKVEAVNEVFRELDAQINEFQQSSGMHCRFGCGKCCFKPDIEATALEFLPFAHHLYIENVAFDWLEKLKSSESICLILNPLQEKQGLCSQYTHRGLICRLFGYSARTNKYNKKELITCQTIKTEQPEAIERANINIEQGGGIPVMNNYYMKLHAIDQQLAQDFYPINDAIKRAIETVLHYYAYRN